MYYFYFFRWEVNEIIKEKKTISDKIPMPTPLVRIPKAEFGVSVNWFCTLYFIERQTAAVPLIHRDLTGSSNTN